MSRADVALADVDVLAGLLTWSDDVSSSVLVCGRRVLSHRCVKEMPET